MKHVWVPFYLREKCECRAVNHRSRVDDTDTPRTSLLVKGLLESLIENPRPVVEMPWKVRASHLHHTAIPALSRFTATPKTIEAAKECKLSVGYYVCNSRKSVLLITRKKE